MGNAASSGRSIVRAIWNYESEFRPNMSIVVKALHPLLKTPAPVPVTEPWVCATELDSFVHTKLESFSLIWGRKQKKTKSKSKRSSLFERMEIISLHFGVKGDSFFFNFACVMCGLETRLFFLLCLSWRTIMYIAFEYLVSSLYWQLF